MPYLRLQVHCGGGNYKSQMKKALKSGADVALVLAEGETETGEITLKYLTEEKPQKTVAWTDLAAELVNS
jgi:histidyl-tRNA synthetase